MTTRIGLLIAAVLVLSTLAFLLLVHADEVKAVGARRGLGGLCLVLSLALLIYMVTLF